MGDDLMRLPKLPYNTQKNKKVVVSTRGINYSNILVDGDLADCRNISARRYPYITTRHARGKQSNYSGVTNIAVKNGIVYVKNGDLYKEGVSTPLCSLDHSYTGDRQIVSVNSKIVVIPDKIVYDLDTDKMHNMDAYVSFGSIPTMVYGTSSPNGVFKLGLFSLVTDLGADNYPSAYRLNVGNTITVSTVSGGNPTIAVPASEWEDGFVVAGDYIGAIAVKDSSDAPFTFINGTKPWKVSGISVASGYATISLENGEGLTDGSITGYSIELRKTVAVTSDGGFISLKDYFVDEDEHITITGTNSGISKKCTVAPIIVNDSSIDFKFIENETAFAIAVVFESAELKKETPDFDFVCESNNRLWGCNSEEHTVHASSLGNPFNFEDDGTDAGGYSVAIGSEGDFTGCCQYGSNVLFFKENQIIKILGSNPSDFYQYSYNMEGVKAGCHKSLIVIDEILYFLGCHGVYAFNGGSNSLISYNFGEKQFKAGVGGNDGNAYYLSVLEEGTNEPRLFVYELNERIWILEDHLRVIDFAKIGKDLFLLDENGDIYREDNGLDNGNMLWNFKYTPFYETLEGKKIYSKMIFRAEIPCGSYAIVSARYDGGMWVEVGKMIGNDSGLSELRFPVNRCDKFEIKVEGKGLFTLLGFMREFSVGGDR